MRGRSLPDEGEILLFSAEAELNAEGSLLSAVEAEARRQRAAEAFLARRGERDLAAFGIGREGPVLSLGVVLVPSVKAEAQIRDQILNAPVCQTSLAPFVIGIVGREYSEKDILRKAVLICLAITRDRLSSEGIRPAVPPYLIKRYLIGVVPDCDGDAPVASAAVAPDPTLTEILVQIVGWTV